MADQSGAYVVIICGSPADEPLARQIGQGLDGFGLAWQVRVASAHKVPLYLLQMLDEYERDGRTKVYITVAGRSNALSGMVDAHVAAPVIACPPYAEKFGGADVLSSLRAPSGVAPAVVLEPEAAALLAAKLLALADPVLRQRIQAAQAAQRSRLLEADAKLTAGRG
jgi:5-(carboxyamino)imidazole ribonucleotide mutase